MWWEPNELESTLAADVRQLRIWFIERSRRDFQTAWGVGSVWSVERCALVPFIILNRDFVGASTFTAPIGPIHPELAAILRLPETRLPIYAMPSSRPHPTNNLVSTAPQILVERVLAEFVPIREPIVCKASGEQGSAGVLVWDKTNQEICLLSAGHVFPHGVGSKVGKLHSPLKRFPKFLSRIEDLGTVAYHIAPSGPNAAWDAAVIRLANIREPDASLVTQKYERFSSPERIRVHGAFSKLRLKAVVQGALTDLGDDEMMWKNCWMAAPSGFLTNGDSGAAVFLDKDSSFLGMYVAQSKFPGSGLALVHYVQDAFTLEQEVLRNWNISFVRGA
jgi:hypothetical protein